MAMKDMLKAAGGVTAIVLAVLAAIGAGIAVWALTIWPAMGENSALNGLGQWLMTFLGPGEAFVTAFAAVAIIVMVITGYCIMCCTGAGNDDNTPNDVLSIPEVLDADTNQADRALQSTLMSLMSLRTMQATRPNNSGYTIEVLDDANDAPISDEKHKNLDMDIVAEKTENTSTQLPTQSDSSLLSRISNGTQSLAKMFSEKSDAVENQANATEALDLNQIVFKQV